MPHDGHSHAHSGAADLSLGRFAAGHTHDYTPADIQANARRTWIVIAVTLVMMVIEIVAGTVYGSMALTADGWHMGTHAGALLIAAIAYWAALKYRNDTRFTFGTGRISDLGGFVSAIALGAVGIGMAIECIARLFQPVAIEFGEAVLVAVIGLIVNIICAFLLASGNEGRDHNLKGAYLHVLADAVTSVCAIAALLLGWIFGWSWLDPAMGALGSLVILRWAVGLLRETGGALLDIAPKGVEERIRAALQTEVLDLHVWSIGQGLQAAAIVVLSHDSIEVLKERLLSIESLAHVTLENAHTHTH